MGNFEQQLPRPSPGVPATVATCKHTNIDRIPPSLPLFVDTDVQQIKWYVHWLSLSVGLLWR